ncbi:MAG: FCD domain-containing protein [Acetobacterales bacterium]
MTDSATGSALALLKTTSLAMLVQEDILARIASGDLVGGDKLSENALAGRLGVSRGPVREAFRTLERAGLLRFERNRGVTVRRVEVDEASEIFEVRAALDGLAARLACARIDDAAVGALRTLVDAMQTATDSGDISGYLPLNLRFHDRVLALAGNRKLRETYRDLVNQILLFRRRTLREGAGPADAMREHHAIVDALARRDADAAERLMRDHVLAARDRMFAVVGPAGDD